MNIGQYIKNIIKEEGRTALWIAKKLDMNYKTFVGKLNRNSISSDELFKISVLLDINLENMKKELDYTSFLMNSRNFVYVPINYSEKELLTKESIQVIKMEVVNEKHDNKNVLINVLLDFDHVNDVKKNGNIKVYAFNKYNDYGEYKLEDVNIHNLKHVYEEDSKGYKTNIKMIKNHINNDTYLLRIEKTFENRGQVSLTSVPRSSSSATAYQFCVSNK